ncbi:MAG: calcium-binding protein [Nocardioides sp.]|nr:calcium-binding protein [Nocardioides sp.]
MMTRTGLVTAAAIVATSVAGVPAQADDRSGPGAAARGVLCHGEPATIVGTARSERLTGTARRDVIAGLAGNDVILGLGGDDVLCGNAGADTLRGGAGDDELFGGRAQRHSDRGGVYLTPNRVVGGAGDDLLDAGRDERPVDVPRYAVMGVVDYSSAAQGVQVDLAAGTATGAGTDTIVPRDRLQVYGTPYDDVLVGGGRDDKLVGADGDDTISGGAGDDILEPDSFESDRRPGDDTVDAGPGADEITSWVGTDDLRGGGGRDLVQAYSTKPAQVRGGGGDDSLTLSLTAAPGYLVDGGPGADALDLVLPPASPPVTDPGTYTLRMAEGTITRGDEMTGTVLDIGGQVRLYPVVRWVYHGTDAVDLVEAGYERAFRAWTYGGDDVVRGSGKPDRINTGAGRDRVDAAGGRDVCVNAEVRRSCEVVRP